MTVTITLGDCMDALREMPDNAYQLAIVDPPYGGGQSVTQQNHSTANMDDSGSDSTVTLKPIRGGGRFDRYKREIQGCTNRRDMGGEILRGYL